MIFGQDPLRRRPKKLTVRRKRQERCVWMAGIRGKWPYRHGQLTKIRLPAFCGEKTTAMVAQFGYDQHGFEGYLGNVGLVVTSRTVAWFFLEQLRFAFMPVFHGVQGRLATQG